MRVSPTRTSALADRAEPATDTDCLTADQAAAVAAVLRVARGRRRRPAVLTSDRGRGKSAALGIAVGRLLAEQPEKRRDILLVAPTLTAVGPVFAHAGRLLGARPAADGTLTGPGGTLRFAAPAELVGPLPEASLVLIDEAAALPLPLLSRLLAAPRVVFATTVHGYEGTGRGFAVRFRGLLDRETPGWRAVRLETPLRWAPNDPIEHTLFRALLLDATPAEGVAGITPADCHAERLDRAALAADEPTLSALFGLLISAHYRTTPADLWRLLDAPNLDVWALRAGDLIVAAALVAREGGLGAAIAARIYEGRRRPHGHLLPETLSAHCGCEEAPTRHFARVVRIAVHPEVQGCGLGTALLDAIATDAAAAGFDALGSVFGVTERLLRFWTRADCHPIRIGVTRGRSSGLYAAVVLRPLTPVGTALFHDLRARFHRDLHAALADPLRDLEPTLVATLLRQATPPSPDFTPSEWRELAAYVHGARVLEVMLPTVRPLTLAVLADPTLADALTPEARALLITRVLQHQPWPAAAAAAGLPGKAPAVRLLARALWPAIAHHGGDAAAEMAARFHRG